MSVFIYFPTFKDSNSYQLKLLIMFLRRFLMHTRTIKTFEERSLVNSGVCFISEEEKTALIFLNKKAKLTVKKVG